MWNNGESIGIALGGGSVLGAAHIGVLKALEESGIQPNFISGTSIGAMVAAFYAFGVDTDTIQEIAKDLKWMDISRISISGMGLLSNDKLGNVLDKKIGKRNIEESKISLAIVATDLSNGEKVVLREGDLATAVMASTCIPGIFIPVETDGRILVDGGLVENCPTSVLEEMGADRIIAVDINARRLYKKPDDIIEVVTNAFDIAMENLSRPKSDGVDLLIRPKLTSYNRTDTGPEKILEIIEKGYLETKKVLEEYKNEQ